ncbi:hypothetical protein ACGFX4_24880 [Kitasatospora sp. NPDC048365]|uniref:hypothetical protein n=1 Tax=Kitasatospora sp. NPDC048365 TaxID=3364050 RepID=UPI00371FF595
MTRARRAAAVTGAFAALVAAALAPDQQAGAAAPPRAPTASTAAAAQAARAASAALPGEPQPLGMPFLPTPTPMRVTIDSMLAVGLTVKNNVTIRLSDGTTRVTTQYTFTQLRIRRNMQVRHTAPDGTAITISVPDTGSLGGIDKAGQPETTIMWGDIKQICVPVLLIPICGIQGLLNFFGSFIQLTAGATNFDADVYGIQTIDDHSDLSNTNNPVHLPGTITVTGP